MDWQLFGNQWAQDLLRGHIVNDRIRHAYLFTGPRGVGRRTFALRFAQAINCTNKPAPGTPCLQCRACRLTERMEHPDLAIVEAGAIGGILKVDQIRELQQQLALSPYEAEYRIALLLRFEEANISASNALLKTIEEPPDKVILLITAESPEMLLPTIVSRCEVIRLRPMPVKELEDVLHNKFETPMDESHRLAHLSQGKVGTALRLRNDPNWFEMRQEWLALNDEVLTSNMLQRFQIVEKLTQRSKSQSKEKVLDALAIWLSIWRDILHLTLSSNLPVTNIDYLNVLEIIAAQTTTSVARSVIRALDRTISALINNANLRLTLEILMLELPQISNLPHS